MRTKEKKQWMPVIFLFIYAICLLAVGILMFQRAGMPTEGTVSINKEKNSPVTNVEKQSLENEQEMNLVEPAELQTVGTVAVNRLAYLSEADDYNGLDLQDNGLEYAIKINRQENIVTIYSLDDNGYYTVPVRAMCCSVSADDTTPIGLFTTSDRFTWALLEGGVYGQYAYRIDGGIWFHSVPYAGYSNDKLETWEFNKLGTGASLGCVRLCVADAKWIFENCPVGTQVQIFDSDYYGPMGKPQPVCILEDTENTGWDPTDMVTGNPYAEQGQIFGAVSHTIQIGEPFDPMSGVLAFSSDKKDVTFRILVQGEVNNQVAGTYGLKYTFYDNGQEISKEIEITVVDEEEPVIIMAPEEMTISGYMGDKKALIQLIAGFITAYDGDHVIDTVKEGVGGLENTQEAALYIDIGNVREEAGNYVVYVVAADASGNMSDTVTIRITMLEEETNSASVYEN